MRAVFAFFLTFTHTQNIKSSNNLKFLECFVVLEGEQLWDLGETRKNEVKVRSNVMLQPKWPMQTRF